MSHSKKNGSEQTQYFQGPSFGTILFWTKGKVFSKNVLFFKSAVHSNLVETVKTFGNQSKSIISISYITDNLLGPSRKWDVIAVYGWTFQANPKGWKIMAARPTT